MGQIIQADGKKWVDGERNDWNQHIEDQYKGRNKQMELHLQEI
jgi:hypothetical protein